MELLQNCRNVAHKYYADLLLAAEKTLANTLFEQAEKSTNNADQNRYYEAMQLLKKNSAAMHDVFRRELVTSYQTFIDERDVEKTVEEQLDLSNLSLVKRDDLEDELAISVIVSKSNSRNSEQIWKLNRRLAALRGGKKVSDETNPFGPAIVCEAVQAAVSELAIENKARILIYKHLGKVLVLSFTKILDLLNESLISRGVLPNLRFSVSKAPSRTAQGATPSAAATIDDSIAVQESASSIAHQHQLYSAILEIQSQLGIRAQTAGGVSFAGLPIDGTGGYDSFSPMDYALALSAVQQSKTFLSAAALNRPLSAEAVEAKLFRQLNNQANKDSRHKMTNDDANTVDLVGMIFRYMLDDPYLNDTVKSMLSHLHTPYLKLALMDKSFLDNYEHSARLLLNRMAEAGSRWVKNSKERRVLPKIKDTVETILNDFIDDVTIFDSLLDNFSLFIESLEKRSRMVEKRNTESQQGLERLETSKQRAADEILGRLEKSQISENIAKIIQQTWEDFLSFNFLRHGEDSEAWKSALKVVDAVVRSVSPDSLSGIDYDFHKHQITLEKTVSDGLRTIGYDAEASKSLIASLRKAHELTLNEEAKQSEPNSLARPGSVQPIEPEPNKADADVTKNQQTVSPESSPESKSQESKSDHSNAERQKPDSRLKPKVYAKTQSPGKTPAKKAPQRLSDLEYKIAQKLRDIAFGTWFEFVDNKNISHLKLAWYSGVSSHYMFVDQDGVKQAVKTQLEIARGIAAGTIRISKPEKASFMERALKSIFDRLNIKS